MKTVYRIEDADGIGPFFSGEFDSTWDDYRSLLADETDNTTSLLSLFARIEEVWPNFFNSRLKGYRFGCTSLETLRVYFGDHLHALATLEFFVTSYDVSEEAVIDDNGVCGQAVFSLNHAQPRVRVSLWQFLYGWHGALSTPVESANHA